jgi:hypothetical protein
MRLLLLSCLSLYSAENSLEEAAVLPAGPAPLPPHPETSFVEEIKEDLIVALNKTIEGAHHDCFLCPKRNCSLDTFWGDAGFELCRFTSSCSHLVTFLQNDLNVATSPHFNQLVETIRPLVALSAWCLHAYVRTLLWLKVLELFLLFLASLLLLAQMLLCGKCLGRLPFLRYSYLQERLTPRGPAISSHIWMMFACGVLVSFVLEERRAGPLAPDFLKTTLFGAPTRWALAISLLQPVLRRFASCIQQRCITCRCCVIRNKGAEIASGGAGGGDVTTADAVTRFVALGANLFVVFAMFHFWKTRVMLDENIVGEDNIVQKEKTLGLKGSFLELKKNLEAFSNLFKGMQGALDIGK